MLLFLFQAEDGIRDHCVTGVQTCALPISCIPSVPVTRKWAFCMVELLTAERTDAAVTGLGLGTSPKMPPLQAVVKAIRPKDRSEERRVGKEHRWRRASGNSHERRTRRSST